MQILLGRNTQWGGKGHEMQGVGEKMVSMAETIGGCSQQMLFIQSCTRLVFILRKYKVLCRDLRMQSTLEEFRRSRKSN